jgi:hypothetical protein
MKIFYITDLLTSKIKVILGFKRHLDVVKLAYKLGYTKFIVN